MEQQDPLAATKAAYDEASQRDLDLLQSDAINFAEFRNRHRQHCAEYLNAQVAAV